MTRKEAKLAGLQHYQTDGPCKRGHVGVDGKCERRVDNGACVICHRMGSARQWEKLKASPPEILAWHYARQKAYVEGRQPPRRPVVRETDPQS